MKLPGAVNFLDNIRKATKQDAERIAEIIVFNYRLNFYPIFLNDDYYFNELNVSSQSAYFAERIDNIWVYDDGVIKGFTLIEGREVKKLFVEPVLQGKSIGSVLLEFAIKEKNVNTLWALEKNTRAIAFYKRHGFSLTEDHKYEDGTTKLLVRLER